jgi:hypothetical protein
MIYLPLHFGQLARAHQHVNDAVEQKGIRGPLAHLVIYLARIDRFQ